MSEDAKAVKKQNWFMRHKVITAIGIVFIFGAMASAINGDEDSSSSVNDSNSTPASQTTTTSAKEKETAVPAEYKSALNKAKSYANTMNMSKAGIYDQLVSEYGEKFAPEAAQYAIDNVQADWNANALAKAKSYQDTMSMSPAAIHDQLTSANGEKFSVEEADYAVAHMND